MFYEIFSRKIHILCVILLKIFDSEDIESEGTLKILDLPGPIVDTLVNGMGQPGPISSGFCCDDIIVLQQFLSA